MDVVLFPSCTCAGMSILQFLSKTTEKVWLPLNLKLILEYNVLVKRNDNLINPEKQFYPFLNHHPMLCLAACDGVCNLVTKTKILLDFNLHSNVRAYYVLIKH
ncbi:hypothetical protein GDO86_015466 [Hymenochirus boettgeri]|uniref:Uncharacterized protein n=1 Tax=Hymenochirus boettgeri TaxID=247094 RepID=A0A8T2JXH7_9PIPI|nr:hypothetical protein GDO86_015466 [Hymenochirus boettgeri]